MIVHMVTSQRAEKEDSNYFVEEIRLFSNLDAAKIFAKHKFEEVLKIFGLTKDDVEIEEVDYLGNGNTAMSIIFMRILESMVIGVCG